MAGKKSGKNGERLCGKTAIISGGASGIGMATAERFVEEGAKVAVGDVNVEKGQELADRLCKAGHDALFYELDVADPASWQKVVLDVVDQWGQLDILLNSAGVGLAYRFLDMTLEDWRKVMAINLDGTFLGTQAAVRAMQKSGGGSIINISSIMGMIGAPYVAAYSASKGGVRIFTKSVAIECAEMGLDIRVNSVHPGYIETPMVMSRFTKSKEQNEAEMKHLKSLHPVGRLGHRDEVANAILFLASDEASFVTGSEIVVDGGYTAR